MFASNITTVYQKELEILLDYQSPATSLAAGGQLVTSPVSQPINPGGTNGSLATDEVAEIVAMEYWPPLDINGNEQFLSDIYYIADGGTDSRWHWKMSGRADLNVFPPQHQVYGTPRLVFIGGGLIAAAAIIQAGPLPGESPAQMMHRAMIQLAVPRYTQQLTLIMLNGPNTLGSTIPIHIRLWGYRYKMADVDALFSGFAFGGAIQVSRIWNHETFDFNVPLVNATSANWMSLAGGSLSIVQPFLRWSIAAAATSVNQEYSLTFNAATTSMVNPNDQYQNMDFDYTKHANVLALDGFCVRALNVSADTVQTDLVQAGVPLAYQYLRFPTDQPHQMHPNNALPASQNDNVQLVGTTYPTFGTKLNQVYDPIRPLAGKVEVIAGQRAYVAFRDNGNSIPANQVGAVLSGLLYQGVSGLVQS